MAYINRLTDINMNLMNMNDKQIIGNTKLNNINGNLDSILKSSNNILTAINNLDIQVDLGNSTLSVSDALTHTYLNTIANNINNTLSVSDSMTHTYLNTISTNLTGMLNTAIFGYNGTTNTQVKVDTMGNVSSISYQLGSYANGISNGSIISTSSWIDITDYTYIVAYYEDTNVDVLQLPTIELSFTNDELSLIIPNITINLVNNGTKRYGRIDRIDTAGIKYIRIRNSSPSTFTNVYFTITGCK